MKLISLSLKFRTSMVWRSPCCPKASVCCTLSLCLLLKGRNEWRQSKFHPVWFLFIFYPKKKNPPEKPHPASRAFSYYMLCTEKRLCTNPVKFLLSMLSALLSNSFEPRPNRCSFLTVSFRRTFRRHFYLLPASSVSIIGFSQKLMLALEKPVWREQTGMTSPRTGATATSEDGLDLCRAYFFRVWRKEIKEALLAGWKSPRRLQSQLIGIKDLGEHPPHFNWN